MDRTFLLEIITPQQQFWQAPVQALAITGPLGSMTVLAGHAPLVAGIRAQQFRIQAEGGWQTFCCADGFLEIRPDEVLLFVQDCVPPDDWDASLAREAAARDEEEALRRRSVHENKASAIQMTRTLVKLSRADRQQQD